MIDVYTILVGVHILSAIVIVGPIFTVNSILRNAKNMNELKFAHMVVEKLNTLIDSGFGLQFITGLLMGLINQSLFQMIWYNLSIGLLVIAGLYFRFVSEPKMKPMLEIVKTYNGDEIPNEYKELEKKTALHFMVGRALVIAIIILMILKP